VSVASLHIATPLVRAPPGRAVTLPAITSIATSLGARRVADRTLAFAREHRVTVSDAQAVRACLRAATECAGRRGA
jgi:L-serine/L-threonine ammonia-lyase